MRSRQRTRDWLAILLAGLLLLGWSSPASAQVRVYLPLLLTDQPEARQVVRVVSVYDGDTFWIDSDLDGEKDVKVRPLSIDTPELRPAECYGLPATYRTRELIDGKLISLEKDVSEVDSFGRWLRYVYLPDGRFLNGLLVREGYAKVRIYEPDHRYADLLFSLQEQAKAEGAGGWSQCSWHTSIPVSQHTSKLSLWYTSMPAYWLTSK